MFKLYRYELKHFLMNKVFLILSVVTVVYGWYLLSSDIILGVANTAPYSPWSFGGYIAGVMPLALACLLALMAVIFSGEEKQVEKITAATPVSRGRRVMRHLGAIYTGFAGLLALLLVIAAIFYTSIFGVIDAAALLFPLLYAVLPGLLLITGVALNLGRLGSVGIYILMALLLLSGILAAWDNLPGLLDLFGGGFFHSYPQIADGADPAFTVPIGTLLGRVLIGVIGLALLALGLLPEKKRR